ncbi:membrane protein [Fischerella sp. PCC 9605]|uniref:membrane protein n=1 Tax=Fischerella sp. PCC 9605 TaxID=1173024 RepID=UPI00047D277E|nr:membrane protein [Fischerella sp. PCC 9605]
MFAVAEQSVSNSNILLISALCAIFLAIIHIFSGKLRFLRTIPRSRWLSFGSGVSVAYVFVHILPELSQAQETIQNIDFRIAFLEHHVYLVALVGLSVFYALERLAKRSRQNNQKAGQRDITSSGVFWIHIASFGVYNALIGYLLLHREEPGIESLLLFFFAMALHFVVNDNGLREHHKEIYDRIGRWLLAAAIIVGWVIGSGTEIHRAAVAVLFAFLAGGVVLNVLKEELPEERESRFWAFALGAVSYAALLLTF